MSEDVGAGWMRVAFGDVVRQVRDRIDPIESGLERYVAGEHMRTDDLRIRQWGLIGAGYLGPAFDTRFKPGHVLYGSRRTYLRKVAVADFDGITANTTFVLEPKNPNVLLPKLLPYLMRTAAFHEHSIKQSKGSVNPYINFSDLAWYAFDLPPPKDQERISRVLDAAVALEESFRDVGARATDLRRAQLDFNNSSRDFEQIRLGSLLRRIVAGKSVAGANIPPADDEYGVLKVSAVDPNGFLKHEAKRLLLQGEYIAEFGIRAGDLIMTRANTPELVGQVCLVEGSYPNLMLCDKTLRLEPAPGVDAFLLAASLQSDPVRRQLQAIATGTGRAMKNISQPAIRDLTVAYPRTPQAAAEALASLRGQREIIQMAQKRTEQCRGLTKTLLENLLIKGDPRVVQ